MTALAITSYLPSAPPPIPDHLLPKTVRPGREPSGVVVRSGTRERVERERDAGLLIGSCVANRYHVTAVLGSGASSVVTKAIDAETGEEVALKILQPRVGDMQLRRRFRREVSAMRSVEHPALVRLLDAGELENGDLFLAMELVRGRTLRDAMKKGSIRTTRGAIAMLGPVAAALDAMHRAGLVHRDVKPENIVLDEEGNARLIDLGIAFSAADHEDRITATGCIAGSPRYVAPEVARGETPSASCDVYALAVILFELIAGDAPFKGRAFDVLRGKVVSRAPTLAEVAGQLCSISLELVMRRALDREPKQRPETATTFLEWLVAALDDAKRA